MQLLNYKLLAVALLTLAVAVPQACAQPTYRTPYAFSNYAGMPGTAGSTDGNGSDALFYDPAGVAVDSAGNLYVTDDDNCTIRKIDTAGNVTTLAGSVGVTGSTDGNGSTCAVLLSRRRGGGQRGQPLCGG